MDFRLGAYFDDVQMSLTDLERRDIIGRIWQKDHTVWKPEPTEITDRLGWLTVTGVMRQELPTIESFAHEIQNAGFQHVVLLGMGGSSLGPEVLRASFGSMSGYPQLIVLDSTVPACVQAVTDVIDPARTLFVVSSKSGTTIEPISLFHYFRSQVVSAVGEGKAGRNFVAITDPATLLARLAEQERFRHTFLNPPDIGGRYSVLSYFGLVPAALIGLDTTQLLDRADSMRNECFASATIPKNPGTWLGAVLGSLALQGRDKLTLVSSPAVSSFGLWVEQLVAESTGKEGKGIIPVVDEPMTEPVYYTDDRIFVYLRLRNDDNTAIDKAIKRIESSGQRVLVFEMRDIYDLGAEFFRWEFATAVTGAIMGIHPFDQPNVQAAKQATEQVLQEYVKSGELPQVESTMSASDLLAGAQHGDYLAIMAYLRQTPEVDRVMSDFRAKVLERYHLATTLGYGPRYLHSTGQLHKGGPEKGLYLMVTMAHQRDLHIPGRPYTFGVLADAQALGDLRALQSSRRRVARMHLGECDAMTLSRLLSELG